MKTFTHLMKLGLVFILVMMTNNAIKAQGPEKTMTEVTNAIGKANVELMSQHFNSSIEITVPGSDKTFSAKQASFVLKEFFTQHPIKSFEVMHQGSSGATYYATGVTYTSGEEFDTNIFLKKVDNKYVVTQIRFEVE